MSSTNAADAYFLRDETESSADAHNIAYPGLQIPFCQGHNAYIAPPTEYGPDHGQHATSLIGLLAHPDTDALMHPGVHGWPFGNFSGEPPIVFHGEGAAYGHVDDHGASYVGVHGQDVPTQGHNLLSHVRGNPSFFGTVPSSCPTTDTVTDGYHILHQDRLSFVLQFNRERYGGNYTQSFEFSRRTAPSERGVPMDILLRRGGIKELSHADTVIGIPEEIAAVVTIWILFPGCKNFEGKIRMRKVSSREPVTVARLAAQIAKVFKTFLKKEPEWAAENSKEPSEIVLMRFFRVSKGSWQIELAKKAQARDAPHAL